MKDIKNIKLVSKNTIYAQVYKLKEVIDGDSKPILRKILKMAHFYKKIPKF